MIVDKFNVQGFAVSPCEADAPLIVDADAVGALAVAAEFLQPVARRTAEIQGFFGSIEHLELDAARFWISWVNPRTASPAKMAAVCLSAKLRIMRKRTAAQYVLSIGTYCLTDHVF